MIPAQGLRSHVHDDMMVRSGAYGAFDSPLPFHSTTVTPSSIGCMGCMVQGVRVAGCRVCGV